MDTSNITTPCTEEPNKKKSSRCGVCKKKLKLMPFYCKCNNKFCITHVQPEEHECTFDHKTELRNQLKKSLIKCVNEKIAAI